MQTLTRKCSFDAGHRVMNEKMKCFNIHGHTYIAELCFEFDSIESIGYAIDFKEVKRVGCQWIDDYLDHAFIANAEDVKMIDVAKLLGSKYWVMSLNGYDLPFGNADHTLNYCNPTAENIGKEIFLAMLILFSGQPGIEIHSVNLHETPNCSVQTYYSSISDDELKNFNVHREKQIMTYAQIKGTVNYDDRKED